MTAVPVGPDYPTDCIRCGGQLYPVVLDPSTPPWICVICRHSWFVAQIKASNIYRQDYDDFGFGLPAKTLQIAVADEISAAQKRGSSARPEQLSSLPVVGLQRLAAGQMGSPFAAQVKATLASKS